MVMLTSLNMNKPLTSVSLSLRKPIRLFPRLNEIMHVKCLARCLPQITFSSVSVAAMIWPLSAFIVLVQSLPWKPGIKYNQEADVKDRKAAGRGVSQHVFFYLTHWGTRMGMLNVK